MGCVMLYTVGLKNVPLYFGPIFLVDFYISCTNGNRNEYSSTEELQNLQLYPNCVSILPDKAIQESPAVADKPARRLRKVCTVYVITVGL